MFSCFTFVVFSQRARAALQLVCAASLLTLSTGESQAQGPQPLPADVATIGRTYVATTSPVGVMADPSSGTLYIMDGGNSKIWTYNPATGFNTTAWLPNTGTGTCATAANAYGDGCPMASATGVRVYGMAIDSMGNIYLADNNHTYLHVVIGPNGAGTTLTNLLLALGVKQNGTVYSPGYMYLILGGGKMTAALYASGAYCATGTTTPPTSGPATKASNALGDGCLASQVHAFGTSSPRGVGVDQYGNIYINDYENFAVRMIVANPMRITGNPVSGQLPMGTITTIAGLGTIGGYAGTAGTPGGFCSGTSGPTMTDAAGDGCLGNQIALGGTSTAYPWGVNSDRFGNVYITDSYQLAGTAGSTTTAITGLVRKLTPSTPPIANSMVSYTITDLVGLPPGLSTSVCSNAYDTVGDGCPGTQAKINVPRGVSLDPAGNVFFSDYVDNMTRRVDAATGLVTAIAGMLGISADQTANCALPQGASTPITTSPVPADAYGAGCLGVETLTKSPQGAPAADANGNAYAIASSAGYVERLVMVPNFGTSTVGTAATGQLEGFAYASSATPASSNALTPSISDYSTTLGSCINTANNGAQLTGFTTSSTVCHASLGFTPKLAGVRSAKITATDSASNTTALPVTGTGIGSLIGVDPGTALTLGSGWKQPSGVATDSSGNVYVSDAGLGTVSRIAGSTVSTVVSGVPNAGAIAVDVDGNVFVVDSTSLYFIAATSSGYAAKSTILTGLSAPGGLTIDPLGNLYVTDSGHSQIFEFAASSGVPSVVNSFVLSLSGTALSTPTALATDAAGDLFIDNTGATQILEVVANSVTATTLVASLNTVTGLDVDTAGDVYYTQSGGPLGVLYAGATAPTIVYPSTARTASGLALDSTGDLVVADSGTPAVTMYSRSTGALALAKTAVGASSAAANATVTNLGNSALTITGTTQTDTTDFTVAAATSNGCGPAAVAPGGICAYTGVFKPTKIGALTDTVAIASNATNPTSPMIVVSGTAVAMAKPASTVSIVYSPSAPVYGTPVSLTITVSAVVASNGTPMGSVSVVVDGGSPVSAPLNAGVATTMLNGLSAGIHNVTASYGGDTTFDVSSNATVVTVTTASTTTALTTSAATIPTGGSVTLTAVVGSIVTGTPTGNVTFKNGTSTLTTVTLPTGSSTATYTTTALPNGYNSITTTYNGDTNFAKSTSSAVSVGVAVTPDFALATLPTTPLTITSGSVGALTIVMTPTNAYTGTVTLSCASGLPQYASCSFSPATLTGGGNNDVTRSTMTVTLVQLSTMNAVHSKGLTIAGILLCPALLGTMVLFRRRLATLMAAVILLACLSAVTGCSTAAVKTGLDTPTGTYTVTVTGTDSASNLSHSIPITLVVQ